jgi:predicted Zn-dependent peptidase
MEHLGSRSDGQDQLARCNLTERQDLKALTPEYLDDRQGTYYNLTMATMIVQGNIVDDLWISPSQSHPGLHWGSSL